MDLEFLPPISKQSMNSFPSRRWLSEGDLDLNDLSTWFNLLREGKLFIDCFKMGGKNSKSIVVSQPPAPTVTGFNVKITFDGEEVASNKAGSKEITEMASNVCPTLI